MTIPSLPTFEEWCTSSERLLRVPLYDRILKKHWRVEQRSNDGGFVLAMGSLKRRFTREQVRLWLTLDGVLSKKDRIPLEEAYRRECLAPYHQALKEEQRLKRKVQQAKQRREAAERREEEDRRGTERASANSRREAQRARIRDFEDRCLLATAAELSSFTELRLPAPTERDRELSGLWVPSAQTPGMRLMMLSARMAECALRDRLAQRHEVRDVAINQLTNPEGRDWSTHDLLVDGVPWDVKSVRQSFHNHEAYTSYCVPRFKESRDGHDVTIAGVLLPYLSEEELASGSGSARWLGTTSRLRLGALENAFSGSAVVEALDFQPDRAAFLPPWLFDYPQDRYEQRDRVLREIAGAPTPPSEDCRAFGYSHGAAIAASGMRGSRSVNARAQSGTQELSDNLADKVAEHGLSLGVIYLTLLEYFLSSIGTSKPIQPKTIHVAIYPTPSEAWPLFVFDPLHSIRNALSSFARLASAPGIDSFRVFAMPNPNIVVGRRSITERGATTLLAYCGGWIGEERPCMMTPLIFGAHESCDCGRLICPKCGFCKKSCQHCRARRDAGSTATRGVRRDPVGYRRWR